jgi:hypothetical protein
MASLTASLSTVSVQVLWATLTRKKCLFGLVVTGTDILSSVNGGTDEA